MWWFSVWWFRADCCAGFWGGSGFVLRFELVAGLGNKGFRGLARSRVQGSRGL